MEVKELDFEESINFINKNKTALIWIGSEPKEYIEELLNLEKNSLKQLSPSQITSMNKEEANLYKNHVFVCYHGNSSMYVANFLKEKYDVETLSMKGGVTRIVGEIF
ncbi:MAG: hypothetical protein QXD23_01490 [Candidatus Micrarchaeaceae archaeon]